MQSTQQPQIDLSTTTSIEGFDGGKLKKEVMQKENDKTLTIFLLNKRDFIVTPSRLKEVVLCSNLCEFFISPL